MFAFLLLATAAYAQTATAEIKNEQGEVAGSAKLSEVPEGVAIDIQVSGLTPGKHGIHIHEFGKCEGPDFKSSGGHFNPTGKKHGHENPEGPHAGDLGNLEAGEDGTAKAVLLAQGATLSEGPNSLLKADGSSIMIHAGPDDEITDPAGNSGARVACGVIVAQS